MSKKNGQQKRPLRNLVIWAALVITVILVSMIDRVDLEGDHVSYLVIAPHPTFYFKYGGGEEGAWRRAHPTAKREPWWLVGRYFILTEIH